MLISDWVKQLKSIDGIKKVLSEPGDCWTYGYDNSRRHMAPDAVVFPESHEHVVEIVKLCNQHHIPLTIRGRGTATTGATVPAQAGLVMSMEHMNNIIKVEPENRLMIVQPGVTNEQVQKAAKEHGFFWPPDPSSAAYCTVGGNISCNSAGPKAVKYGVTRDHVLGLKVVTGDGRSLKTGVKTTKGVVGYDFTRLLIGSEGSLAITTEAILKLTPLPETTITMQVIFSDIQSATQCVSAIMAQPITPCALEFIDKAAIGMIRDYSSAYLPEQAGALLMIELDGNKDCLESQVDHFEALIHRHNCLEFKLATTTEEVKELWKTRKALSPALRKIAPKKINEDVVVPVANIPKLLDTIEQLSKQYNLPIVNFGHAGNGNIHVNLLTDPDDPEKLKLAYECLDKVFQLVLELDGTLSGEHGIGLEKKDYVSLELDEVSFDLMKGIKKQFDPNSILNPGKLI